jgi:hypothetical protein
MSVEQSYSERAFSSEHTVSAQSAMSMWVLRPSLVVRIWLHPMRIASYFGYFLIALQRHPTNVFDSF